MSNEIAFRNDAKHNVIIKINAIGSVTVWVDDGSRLYRGTAGYAFKNRDRFVIKFDSYYWVDPAMKQKVKDVVDSIPSPVLIG